MGHERGCRASELRSRRGARRWTLSLALLGAVACGPAPGDPGTFVEIGRESVREVFAAAGLTDVEALDVRLASDREVQEVVQDVVTRQLRAAGAGEAGARTMGSVVALANLFLACYDSQGDAMLIASERFDAFAERAARSGATYREHREAFVRGVLRHEAGHAVTQRQFDFRGAIDGLRHPSMLRPFGFLVEGHAQSVARAAGESVGRPGDLDAYLDGVWSREYLWWPTVDGLFEPLDMLPASATALSQYVDGERLVRALRRAGGDALVRAAFARLPRDLIGPHHPPTFLAWLRATETDPDAEFSAFRDDEREELDALEVVLERVLALERVLGRDAEVTLERPGTLAADATFVRVRDLLGASLHARVEELYAGEVDLEQDFGREDVRFAVWTFDSEDTARAAWAALGEVRAPWPYEGRSRRLHLTQTSSSRAAELGDELRYVGRTRSVEFLPDEDAEDGEDELEPLVRSFEVVLVREGARVVELYRDEGDGSRALLVRLAEGLLALP